MLLLQLFKRHKPSFTKKADRTASGPSNTKKADRTASGQASNSAYNAVVHILIKEPSNQNRGKEGEERHRAVVRDFENKLAMMNERTLSQVTYAFLLFRHPPKNGEPFYRRIPAAEETPEVDKIIRHVAKAIKEYRKNPVIPDGRVKIEPVADALAGLLHGLSGIVDVHWFVPKFFRRQRHLLVSFDGGYVMPFLFGQSLNCQALQAVVDKCL
jgi:hypothetical protein